MTKFSVVIPTYNRATYVRLAIESVLRQTYRDFEIVVVDDGSSDNTRDVVLGLTGPIRYVHQANQGVSSARNRGVREATGEWIAFLDSDDEWEPDNLAKQVALIEKYPSIVSATLNSKEFNRDGTTINKFIENGLFGPDNQQRDMMAEVPFDLVIRHDITILDSCIFRRANFLQTRLFDELLTIAEDLDVVMQMALEGPFAFSVEMGTRIYHREEAIASLSTQLRSTGISARLSWARVFDHAMDDKRLSEAQVRQLRFRYSRNQRSLGNLFLRAGETDKARDAYRHSYQLWPSLPPKIRLALSYLPFGLGTLFLHRDRDVEPKVGKPTK